MRFGVQADGTTGQNRVHLGIVSIAFDGDRAAFLNGFDLFSSGIMNAKPATRPLV
jgi:hypothetical protein